MLPSNIFDFLDSLPPKVLLQVVGLKQAFFQHLKYLSYIYCHERAELVGINLPFPTLLRAINQFFEIAFLAHNFLQLLLPI